MDAAKLQDIRNAEKQAAQIADSIDEEAQNVIRNARSEAQKTMDQAKVSVRKHEETQLAEFQKKGQQKSSEILSSLEGDLLKLDKTADAGEKEAIALVLSEMKVFYGNR